MNNQRLIQELTSLHELDGRYTGMTLVNMPTGVKRGFFSLVFRAHDKLHGKDVALKFFDQDPTKADPFRILCFDREHEVLTRLVGVSRCLQVISPISSYVFNAGTSTAPFMASAKYFATEWLDADIDEFFLRQDPTKALTKLRIFNEALLGIQALHQRGIFHRDIKYDNFRRASANGVSGVVAIDLGTAAAQTSKPLATAYAAPVGFSPYSAPEAFCGLAGDREIAYLTDTYALGCMLFELYAEDDFQTAYNAVNPHFQTKLAAIRHVLAPYLLKPDELKGEWDRHAPRLLAGLTPVALERDGSSVPLAIADIINDLIAKMTSPNFRARTIPLEQVRRRIRSAITCLENDAVARARAARAAAARQLKRDRARAIGSISAAVANERGTHGRS